MTKFSYQIILMEDTAREKAHKLGLVGVGGYWYTKSDIVNGKVRKGSSPKFKTTKGVLVAVSPKKAPPKASFSPTKSTKTPTVQKRSLAASAVKTDDEEFRMKSEISSLLISQKTTPIMLDGKQQLVRLMVDKSGKPLDVKNEKVRKQASKLIFEQIKKFRPKIVQAAKIAHGSTLAKKWLGDVGELYTLGQLLEAGAEAYLLPDSEPKNDIVLSFAHKNRNLAAQYISVKSTYTNEEINRLGANALSDVQNAVGGKAITFGNNKVFAADYLAGAFSIKRQLMNSITRGRVGRVGIYISPDEKNKLMSAPEKLPKGLGFASQAAYLKSRKITLSDLKKLDIDPNDKIMKNLVRDLFIRIKKNSKLSLADLSEFLVDEIAFVLSQTRTVIQPRSDLMAFRFNETDGIGDDAVRVACAEDVFALMKDKVKKSGIPQKNGIPLNARDQVKYFLGLDQRTRALGKKDEDKAYLDPIINSTPTVSTLGIERTVAEYLNILKTRK